MVDLYDSGPVVDFFDTQYVPSNRGKLGLIIVVDEDVFNVYSQPTRRTVEEMCELHHFDFENTISLIDKFPDDVCLLTINAAECRNG